MSERKSLNTRRVQKRQPATRSKVPDLTSSSKGSANKASRRARGHPKGLQQKIHNATFEHILNLVISKCKQNISMGICGLRGYRTFESPKFQLSRLLGMLHVCSRRFTVSVLRYSSSYV